MGLALSTPCRPLLQNKFDPSVLGSTCVGDIAGKTREAYDAAYAHSFSIDLPMAAAGRNRQVACPPAMAGSCRPQTLGHQASDHLDAVSLRPHHHAFTGRWHHAGKCGDVDLMRDDH